MKCCICDKEIADGSSHNAAPVSEGRCCDVCNKIVLKYRLMEIGLCMIIAEELSNITKEEVSK